MTAEQIKKLIAEGESFTVEFKKNTNELNRDVFETVASFSNRYGGHIILGVEDNGVILGVNRNNAISIKKNFVNQLNNPNFIMPSLFLNLEEIELDGKILLYVYVPVASQLVLLGGKIYDRTEDADIDITRSVDLVANLVRRKSLEFTERRIFSYTTKADLRLAELMPKVRIMANTHIKNHPWTKMSDMEILRSAGLYEDDKTTGKQGFNLAGILLFGRDEIIQSCTPNYVTDAILRRVNLDRYDDRLRVETNLIDSFGLLIDFIAKHTLDKFFLIDNQSVSVRNAIAREIVSNSLVHREYTSTVPAQIIVEKDRIIAQNWCRATYQGKLDPSKFTPEPKNPLLAKFFVNIGYADQLGSGVRNLYKFTRIYSGCDPELIEGDIFKTIIPLTENCSASEEIQREVGRKSGESREKVGRKSGETLTKNQRNIIEQMKTNSTVTAEIIAKELSLALRTVERNVRLLKEAGFIVRHGENKGGYWEVL